MKKGITVASAALLIAVVFILLGTISITSYNSVQNAKKIVFALEMSNIEESVQRHVNNNVDGEYPISEHEYLIDLSDVSSSAISQFDEETINADNEVLVYELDLKQIGITDTTYGNKKTEKDVYVISKTTGRIYYLEGIKFKGMTYYTLTEDIINLKNKQEKQEEKVSSPKPIILTDGFVTKTLTDGTKEIYLSNISVENAPKIFKYEIGIISRENAREYFANNGKTVLDDRLNFSSETDVTLYAESSDGEYYMLHCLGASANGLIYPGLYENAKTAILNGLKVGDEVVGYNTYLTSKTEPSKETENGYQDQNVSNKTDFIWKYIGVSNNGEIMIAPDLTENSPEITLSGKIGYLKGAAELNRICSKLYSSNAGTSRNMNIDDVHKILEYTGPKEQYYSKDNCWKDLGGESLTIGQIVEQKGEPQLESVQTPDGVNTWETIKKYRLNFYSLYKSNSNITSNKTKKNLIYQSQTYFLSSVCIIAFFNKSYADFDIYIVNSDAVKEGFLFNSDGGALSKTQLMRPVVSLKSDVKLVKPADIGEAWTIS